jgi:hypothetical protein
VEDEANREHLYLRLSERREYVPECEHLYLRVSERRGI